MLRPLWFALGALALGLGILGAALPLLPTTPFVLLAAFCFARSSERWHQWLLTHRTFGPLIRDWQEHRAMNRRTKLFGVLSLVVVFLISLAVGVSTTVLAVQAVVLGGCAIIILSFREPPP